MLAKVKKFFLSFLIPNKKSIPVLLFFILLGTFLPFYFTEAFVEVLAMAIISVALWTTLIVPLLLSSALLGAAGLYLNYVTSPTFLNISYTVNPFVTLGWTITRDLANMFFILILVVIALATILRIGDYQAKKALPLLIIIALFINFTPVIAGIIIDFFNLLMDFFLGEGLGLDSLLVGLATLGSGIIFSIQELSPFVGIGAIAAIALLPIILIIFNLITSAIFSMLALLFIMRPIALMMLVILSPIAFLAYVLPATRDFFTQWWKQFFQWCIIGVIAAFFLYLSNQLAFMMFQQGWGGLWEGAAGGGAGAEEPGGVLIAFIPVLIVLGFLLMGFVAAVTTSAAGASHLISFGKGAGKWAGKALAVKAGIVAARKYPKVAHQIAERTGKWSKGLENKGWLGTMAAKPFRWTERGAAGLALHGETLRVKTIEERQKKLTGKGVPMERRLEMAESGDIEDQIDAVLASISEFESDDLLERLGQDNLVRIREEAKKINLHKDIDSCYPHLYKEFNEKELKGLTEEERLLKEKEIKNSIFKRISVKPDVIPRINENAYKTGDEDINNRLRKALEGNINKALSTATPEIQDLIVKMYQKVITNATGSAEDKFRELVKRHPKVARYFTTGPGARNLGLSLKTGVSREIEQAILSGKSISPTSAPLTEEELAKKTIMEKDLADLRKRFAELTRIPPAARRPKSVEEMKMIEQTIEDIKKRLKK